MFRGLVGNRVNAGNFIQEDKARRFMLLMNCLDMWNSVKFQDYHLDLRGEKILIC